MIRKLILITLFLVLATPLGFGFADASQKKALEMLKNRLSNVKDRLNAIEELKSVQDSQIVTDLINIVRDSEDSIAVRGQIIELLITLSEPETTTQLKKLLNDDTLPSEVKRLALYALWKKEPQGTMSDLIRIAQNQKEATDLRTTALAYLGQTQGKYPIGFWKNLFLKRENPVPVRIAAMNGMETLRLLDQEQITFIQVLQNPNEFVELRKSVILTAGRVLSPSEFQTEMILIVSKPQNPIEIRRFAIDNLGVQANEALLPQLKQIAAQEKDSIVLEQLKSLINNITSKN